MPLTPFQVTGSNAKAAFTLKLHRGEGMVLLGMNWGEGTPPMDFVGFAIEYQVPGAAGFVPVMNRLAFPQPDGEVNPQTLSSLQSPIQKFRWVHFPPDASQPGDFRYRVTPVFMDPQGKLSYGPAQEAPIGLGADTYPDELNVAFTRGFVSSQAFVDKFTQDGHSLDELLPSDPDQGLSFKPTHPDAQKAFAWMGFEARDAILSALDEAVKDNQAKVQVIAYDLNEPEVVDRLKALGNRLRIIIDDSGSHRPATSAESQAEALLRQSAGEGNVIRQHMKNLQHNKTIVVRSPTRNAVVCGSTNFSWRAFFVQSNNAVVLKSKEAADVFGAAFDVYFEATIANRRSPGPIFQRGPATAWTALQMPSIDAKVTFSPHPDDGGVLDQVAADVDTAESSVLFSLAFLYQTQGAMRDAIQRLEEDPKVFVYGMSDRRVGGLDMKNADGHFELSEPEYLHGTNIPEPFKSEPSGVPGIRLHHKFLVVDFDKPTARVYMGSYNFSSPADIENGENLLVIKDQRVASAYMVEALRLFDHYEFRARQTKAGSKLELATPPKTADDKPWWDRYWTEPARARDRELFS
jgi:phosphatidylserine/phosphatidylglycerophosphate/cardiolipin synthase-like enzyme